MSNAGRLPLLPNGEVVFLNGITRCKVIRRSTWSTKFKCWRYHVVTSKGAFHTVPQTKLHPHGSGAWYPWEPGERAQSIIQRLANGDKQSAVADALGVSKQHVSQVRKKHLTDMAKAVHEHAESHYAEGGWDVIVECWETEEIVATLSNTSPFPLTAQDAIKRFEPLVSVWAEQQADVRNNS
ncbi:helix-turn-helix domain-containing protein [Streptomyces sp. NPDC002644]